MKKFFICLAILGIFGAFIFFTGWTSIRIKPEQVGVVVSKTGGVDETPVVNGKFSWHKEFLLPTNAVLKSFSLEPLTVEKTSKGSLASGEVYTSILGSSNNFGYEFDYTFTLSITEYDLIDLIKTNKVKTQDDLKDYMNTAGDIIAQLTTDYILKKIEANPRFSVESIRRDELTKTMRIYQECPEVQLSLFAVKSSKIPDYDLYNKVRTNFFTNDYTNKYTLNTQDAVAEENTETAVQE